MVMMKAFGFANVPDPLLMRTDEGLVFPAPET